MSIKIITDPKVYMIGRQSIDAAELDRFLADEGVDGWTTDTEVAGQKLVETAGRLCYKSYAKPRPGGNAAYIGHILEVGHGSVLEHAVFNFIITGVSRSFTHELVRHRAGFGFSQRSQRYCDESEGAFVKPPLIDWFADDAFRDGDLDYQRKAQAVAMRWRRSVVYAQESYQNLCEGLDELIDFKFPDLDKTARRKRAREAARSVLPNATETQIFVTGNARALRHFVEMRGDASADAEIRRVAVEVLRCLAGVSPNIFGDYVVTPTGDDAATISTPHRKV